jgi:ribosomal protein L37AE/L43A
MDKALQDELNVDPWTPGDPAQFTVEARVSAEHVGPPRLAHCPACKGPLLAAVTRESSVTIGVCEKCRRRWAPEVLTRAQP